MTKLIFLLAFINCSFHSLSLDTLKYKGYLSGALLIETIELYDDGKFKWRSEYDLNWSESGEYEISNDKLTLNFSNQKSTIETYLITETGLIKLDEEGKPIKKIKDKSFKSKWSWIKGHKHKYEIKNNT